MNASAYIPDGSELEKKIKLNADSRHDGKVSAYVRKCIEKDIYGVPDIEGKQPIEELARVFRRTLLPKFAGLKDQPRIIDNLLEALSEALHVATFDPTQRFKIFNDAGQLETIVGAPGVLEKIIDIFEQRRISLYPNDASPALAAEDKGIYAPGPATDVIKTLEAHHKQDSPAARKSAPTPRERKPTAQA